MPFLLRKIQKAKWEPKEELPRGAIPADAITSDMRTRSNRLSFWRAGNDGEDAMKEVVLALAANFQRLDKIDIVCIDENSLRDSSIDVQDCPGRTPVRKLKVQHVDAVQLDMEKICLLARTIASSMKSRFKRFRKKEVGEILLTAVQEGRLELDRLQDNLRSDLRGHE